MEPQSARPGSKLHIATLDRDAIESHLSELVEVSRATWDPATRTPWIEPWSEDHFRYALPGKFALSTYLADDDRIVGVCIAHERASGYGPRSDTPYGFIAKLAVHPDYQGDRAHVGRERASGALFDASVERIEGAGLHAVRLGVLENNPGAVRFYECRGFVPIGTHAGTVDLVRIVMERDLR